MQYGKVTRVHSANVVRVHCGNMVRVHRMNVAGVHSGNMAEVHCGNVTGVHSGLLTWWHWALVYAPVSPHWGTNTGMPDLSPATTARCRSSSHRAPPDTGDVDVIQGCRWILNTF